MVAQAVENLDAVAQFMVDMQHIGYVSANDHLMQMAWRALILAGRPGVKGIQCLVLQGPPGVGKTFFAECLAQYWDAYLLDLQFTTGVGREAVMDDIHLANVLTAQSGKWKGELHPVDTLQPGILVQAMELSQQKKTILLLDELDKSKHQVDAMLLGFLQSGRLNLPARGEVKADTSQLLCIITMNDERVLSEPLMRRLRSITLDWPDKKLEWALLRRLTRAFAKANPDLLQGSYKDGAPEPMCEAIITLANKIRSASQECSLKKVPSTPELVQCLIDMMITPNKRRRGLIAADWLFKYDEDRQALVEAKKFVENDDALAAIFAGFN